MTITITYTLPDYAAQDHTTECYQAEQQSYPHTGTNQDVVTYGEVTWHSTSLTGERGSGERGSGGW